MDLMEFKAKELFCKYNLPANVGFTYDSSDELIQNSGAFEYPAVLKAQVQTGGRGKAGGIKFCNNAEEVKAVAPQLLGLDIKGHIVKKVMVTKKTEVVKELYLSIMLDRNTKCPVIIFTSEGGVDIEQTAKEKPELVTKTIVDPIIGIKDYTSQYLADKAGLNDSQTKELKALLLNLYRLFMEYSCLLCEINPLAITDEGHLSALDGKVSVDDSALKRLPELQSYEKTMEKHPLVKEAEEFNFLYIPCEESGDIAVMSNGSGMLMSCIDLISKNSMSVRASLDLGGGATSSRIKEAVRLILSDPKTELLFINIFGGITRCDEVAGGIKLAVEEYQIEKPVIVRFEGTNKEIGLETIKGMKTVTYVPGLVEGVAEIVHIKSGGILRKAGVFN